MEIHGWAPASRSPLGLSPNRRRELRSSRSLFQGSAGGRSGSRRPARSKRRTPLPRQEGHRARRARRLPDVRLARDRPRRPHLRRDVHQRRGSDIWPDDRNLALQLTGELLTLRSEQRAAPYGAAPRPEASADQLCQRNCCGLRADSWEIITLTSAGPRNAIAASSALFRSFGFSTNQPLPPKASIILS